MSDIDLSTEGTFEAGGFFRCAHRRSAPRLKTSSNGARLYGMQCLVCGDRAGPPMKKGAPVEGPWDEALRRGFTSRMSEALKAHHEHMRAERDAAWRTTYEAHLASAKWKSLRRRAIEREGGLCQGCRLVDGIEVHHMTYDRLGDELLTDLVLFCIPCHERFHAKETA